MTELKRVNEKRAFHRIPARIDARFFCDKMFYSATVFNVSEKGIYMRTKHLLPPDAFFILLLKTENGILKAIAGVRWTETAGRYSGGIGAELFNAGRDYLEFIKNLRSKAVQSCR